MTEEKKSAFAPVEEKKVEEKPKIDVDSLVKELEKAGVTNVDELSGKLRASQETGRLAQLLGDERKRTAEYETKLRELQTRPAPKQDFMDYGEGQPIDIEASIERSVDRVLTKREETQRRFQEESLKKWNHIQSDEDYGIIKEVWENKLKDPNFVYKIQSGIIDPVADYNSTKINYYKTLLKKSHETITTMHGGKINPPHVESGERSANIVSETQQGTEAQKKISELRKKTEKGHNLTNEEEIELMDALFGSKAPL